MLGLVEISGAGTDLQKILNGKIVKDLKSNFPKGSNAIAISNIKTVEEETFLAVNSHQPLEGWYSWYEAHLISDEGQNILGGTFPGGATIFHGTNQYLGWAHTVNHADFSDVYKLEIDPNDELRYKVDSQWYTLDKKSVWAWMKVAGPIKIPVKRVKYTSIFGPAFITDHGTYAWRFAAHDAVAAVEQWYHMGRAASLDQFIQALKMQAIPCTNIVYADREHNIMYLSNGRFPEREPRYNWREIMPGNDHKLLWDDRVVPLDSLPQVVNPASGFVFNTNNSPFSSTDSVSNPTYKEAHAIYGYQEPNIENNRSLRFLELIAEYDQLTYADFKNIKYDVQYPQQLQQPAIMNLELVLQLVAEEHPDLKEAIIMLNTWNRRCDKSNTTAPLFLLTLHFLNTELKESERYIRGGSITIDDAIKAIKAASDELTKVHGTLAVPLSKVMRHSRGEVNLPLDGGTDVLAAIYGSPQEDGSYRATAGESYIQLVRFSQDTLPIIETINAFGSSAEPDSPHYTDQMELFAAQKLKPMTLSLEEVKAQSVRRYHPLKIK